MIIRLCYASIRHESSNDLIEDLNSILSTARNFNRKNEIYGVLYYANNHFFQCIEGENHIVKELFQRIKTDTRHQNIIEFEITSIDTISFKNLGFKMFTPTALKDENLNIFLKVLLCEKQVSIRKKVGLNLRGVTPYL
jgi:Sensors of blue-light using FAD